MRDERKQNLAADLERFNKAMKDVGESDSDIDWEEGVTTKPKKKQSTPSGQVAEAAEDSDYSDWEGLVEGEETSSPGSILKRKQYFEAEDDDEEETTVVIEEMEEANAHFVFPEKSVAVLKESLKKASFAAKQAMIYGFPSPSIYRDDNEPADIDEDEEDEVDDKKKNDKKNTVKPKQKKKKFRYLTKTERKTNVSKERGRSKEKRTRGKK